MVLRRWSQWVLRLTLACGCGHTEEEWRGKVRELNDIRTQLSVEQAQAKKGKAEIDEAGAKIEQLEQQLRAAGVDVGNLNANLEQQARATEEFRRRAEHIDAYKRRIELLRGALGKLGINVIVRNNRLAIQLPGDVLFDNGHETLRKDGRALLAKVANVVRSDPSLAARSFQVAGHLDGGHPGGGPFKDSWGLSAMRAREVVAYLVQPVAKGGGGLNPVRWSAAGYGEIDPIKTNDNPEGRQANRRCELVILPNAEELLDLKELIR